MQMQLPLETIQEAANLYNRYQAGSGFRVYLRDRRNMVLPVVVLMVLTAVACTAGTVVCIAGARAFLMLFALLLAPFLLVGSLFVQSFVFFGWLENRALQKGLRHALEREGPVKRWLRKKLKIDMGKFPPIPWLYAGVFLLLPLLATAAVMLPVAAAIVLLHAAALLAFARLDR
jgi:hypothetical protein